jgi:hypothetical protein
MENRKLSLMSVGDYKTRRLAFLFAFIHLLIDIIIGVFDLPVETDFNTHIILHFFILLMLIMAVTCKERVDDEFTQAYRYGAYKFTLVVLIPFSVLGVYIASFFNVTKVPVILILYVLEGIILLYFIVYKVGMLTNKKWLIEERLYPKDYNLLIKIFFGMITALIIFRTLFFDLLFVGA